MSSSNIFSKFIFQKHTQRNMINLTSFNSLFDLLQAFSSEQKCIDYLEQLRWGDRVVSPFDPTSKVYTCANGYWCKNSKRKFNVKTRTIFENSKIPLQKWFIAIWMITSRKKGVSSMQLSKDISVTQKTSWFMLQRIRQCFAAENRSILHNEVEIDETYIGGKKRYVRPFAKSNAKVVQGRLPRTKIPIIGMVERNGKLVSHLVRDTKSPTLLSAIIGSVDRAATIYTDEWKGYKRVGQMYNHLAIKHRSNEFANGRVCTNTIEGFWGLLKRGLMGVYHNVSKKYLQSYIDEFVFRYNTRLLNDSDRFNELLFNAIA